MAICRIHQIMSVVLMVLNACSFTLMLLFSADTTTGEPAMINRGVFLNCIWTNESAVHFLTPQGFHISLTWGLVYFFQAACIAVAAVSLFWSCVRGAVMLFSPCDLTFYLHVMFWPSACCSFLWLIIWMEGYLLIAPVALTVLGCACMLGVHIRSWRSMSDISHDDEELKEKGRSFRVYLLHCLFFNAVALYVSWTVIALVLNLGFRFAGISAICPSDEDCTTTISLILTGTMYAPLVFMDLIVTGRKQDIAPLCTFSPYMLVFWILAGIWRKNLDQLQPDSSITAGVMTGLAALAVILKLAVAHQRQRHMKSATEGSEVDKPGVLGCGPLRAVKGANLELRVWATEGSEVGKPGV